MTDIDRRRPASGTLVSAALAAALCGVATAAPELRPGDEAPGVDIAHFFQGAPVRGFDKEKTYVLEFWATW